jgi:hypothetical protein
VAGEVTTAVAVPVGLEVVRGVAPAGTSAEADTVVVGAPATVNRTWPEMGCPSADTTRYATRYAPGPSDRIGTVTVRPAVVAASVPVAPDGVVTAARTNRESTASVKVRLTDAGTARTVAPSAGVEETSSECALDTAAGPATTTDPATASAAVHTRTVPSPAVTRPA